MKKIDKNYIENFWVGLMDGDGSIQVNHWRKKNLQYRLVIKLKYTVKNLDMLNLIAKTIGGQVNQTPEWVVWVENYKSKIILLLKIFKKFPPLTTRLRCQILFMEDCMLHNDVKLYLKIRKDKYLIAEKFLTWKPEEFVILPYFKEWLSGFIEAEGCFCLRKNGNHSFSISQKINSDLLLAIKIYLRTSVRVRHVKPDFFILETYNKASLKKISEHCITYPLLGQKSESFKNFYQYI